MEYNDELASSRGSLLILGVLRVERYGLLRLALSLSSGALKHWLEILPGEGRMLVTHPYLRVLTEPLSSEWPD